MLIKSDCIVATSPKYGLESKSLAKFQEKVVSIPIGIDRMNGVKETLVNEIRSKHREKKIVFSLGRLVYYKGFEYLIKAAKHLADDYVVLIGGVGPLENKLKSLVKSENLQQRVYLIGKIAYDDLPSYYEAADIFCMSSIEASEAFGVVQLEAMSLGKPVVSTKISRSGVDWVNADKVSGITVDVRSSVKIAEAIEEICSNPQLYKKLSEGAYQRFENMFNKEIMVNSIADLYLTYCK